MTVGLQETCLVVVFNDYFITLAYLGKDYLKTKSNKSSLEPTLCGFVQAEEHMPASEA